MEINPIGIIHTPFMELENMPIQPMGAAGVEGAVDVFAEFQPGLKDLDGFSHIFLLYAFHHSTGYNLEVIPFMDTTPRGLFSTRAPKRPNPIGISIVKVDRIENGVIHIKNIDVLDGTPLLDIKPYVPAFDCPSNVQTGWIANSKDSVTIKRSDNRFK